LTSEVAVPEPEVKRASGFQMAKILAEGSATCASTGTAPCDRKVLKKSESGGEG
tara:strand:- start:512 stop:673 length:162 start_codon:yes stop_codon:yes gene_type:complete